jgi:hypothetical protein
MKMKFIVQVTRTHYIISEYSVDAENADEAVSKHENGESEFYSECEGGRCDDDTQITDVYECED